MVESNDPERPDNDVGIDDFALQNSVAAESCIFPNFILLDLNQLFLRPG